MIHQRVETLGKTGRYACRLHIYGAKKGRWIWRTNCIKSAASTIQSIDLPPAARGAGSIPSGAPGIFSPALL